MGVRKEMLGGRKRIIVIMLTVTLKVHIWYEAYIQTLQLHQKVCMYSGNVIDKITFR